MTALADKTVIFVTHQVEFLPAVDLILVWIVLILCNSCFWRVLLWNIFHIFFKFFCLPPIHNGKLIGIGLVF